MVKIDRSPTAPASLAVEKGKVCGSYKEPDVIRQLKADFNGKCYVCELNDLPDIEVEHLLPHYNRKIIDRVFDWNNLFYSCPHCNSIKNNRKYDEKVLDCCRIEPEEYLCHELKDQRVSVRTPEGVTDENARVTADLIQSCFELRNTGIREVGCEARFSRLADTMHILYKTLGKYKQEKDNPKHFRALRGMLNRNYKFAGFTRYYVRTHLQDYPELQDLVF